MLIQKRSDLLHAAELVLSGDLEVSQIRFADYITETIKIEAESWGNASTFNYKAAELALAIQNDTLGLYNALFNTNITLKNICDREFLLVRFSIEDGCIKLTSLFEKVFFKKLLDFGLGGLRDITKDMTPKQKIGTLLIILAIVGVAATPSILSYIKSNRELDALVNTNEKLLEVIAENQRTPNVVISNIGSGTVFFDDGIPYDAASIKGALIKKPKQKDHIPAIHVDDEFIIVKYDFDQEQAYLSHPSGHSFWVSTKWLTVDRREKLKGMTASAIDNRTAVMSKLNLTCKIASGKKKDAILEGIAMPDREGSATLLDALGAKPGKYSGREQATLPIQKGERANPQEGDPQSEKE